MIVSREVFERIKGDCENPPAPSESLKALVRGTATAAAVREAFDRWVALYGEPVPLLLHHLTGPYGRADL
jgi:hypothetical protein